MGERTKVTDLSYAGTYVWTGEVERPKRTDYEVECPECGYGNEFGRLFQDVGDCLRCNTPYLVEIRGPETTNVVTGSASWEQSPQELRTKKQGRNSSFAGYKLLCPECSTRMDLAEVVEDGEACWKCNAEIEIWLEVEDYRVERGWPDWDKEWEWPPSERSE